MVNMLDMLVVNLLEFETVVEISLLLYHSIDEYVEKNRFWYK